MEMPRDLIRKAEEVPKAAGKAEIVGFSEFL